MSVEKFGEYALPENISFFKHEDWVNLIASLKKVGYKFEIKVGVVSYYN